MIPTQDAPVAGVSSPKPSVGFLKALSHLLIAADSDSEFDRGRSACVFVQCAGTEGARVGCSFRNCQNRPVHELPTGIVLDGDHLDAADRSRDLAVLIERKSNRLCWSDISAEQGYDFARGDVAADVAGRVYDGRYRRLWRSHAKRNAGGHFAEARRKYFASEQCAGWRRAKCRRLHFAALLESANKKERAGGSPALLATAGRQ